MAFFQDTGPSREPFLNAPASVLWLIGVILVAHVGRVLLPATTADDILVTFAFIPADYSQIQTWATYLFLHGSYAHVGLNCLWLLAFGPPVARRLGTFRFLAFYFFCGVAAAAAQLASDWGSSVPVTGASGAIAGLMGGAIRILYTERHRVFGAPLVSVFSRPVMFFTAIWLAINVVAGVSGLGLSEEGDLIAWVAHMGGYFAGLLTIGLFDRTAAPVGSA